MNCFSTPNIFVDLILISRSTLLHFADLEAIFELLVANYSFASNTYFCHWKLLMDFFKVSQPENLTFHSAQSQQSTGRDNGGCLTHSPRITAI